VDDVLVSVEDGLELLADRDQAQQVLVNLLGNARKYGAAPYEVRARRTGASWVELRVLDRGPGVSHDLRARMFDQFARGGDVASIVEGSGLGLSIVRALVHAQHGDVVYEDRLGGGAAFVVRLLAAPRTRPTSTPVAGSSDSSSTSTRSPSSTAVAGPPTSTTGV
jgi:signal transduction histidine kinase